MKTYQLFVKIEKENENDLLLTVSLLGLLGFFWRSESSSYKKIKNLEVVNRAMLFRDNDCGYIGFDASFEVQKITSSSDNIYYKTLQKYEEDNKDHPHILISPKELFNLFKQFHEEYKLPDPEFPSRLDVLKNPCITISEECEIVFKDNTVSIFSIDTEVDEIENLRDLNAAVSKSSYKHYDNYVNHFLHYLRKYFYNSGLLQA